MPTDKAALLKEVAGFIDLDLIAPHDLEDGMIVRVVSAGLSFQYQDADRSWLPLLQAKLSPFQVD